MIFSHDIATDTEKAEPIINWQHGTVVMISLALACFFSSLFLTAFITTGNDIRGFWVLVLGWVGLLIFQFAWFANPVNLLALLLLNKHPFVALILSLIAVLIASQTFYFHEIPTELYDKKIYIKELGLGFYVWYLSQILILIGVTFELIRTKNLIKSGLRK